MIKYVVYTGDGFLNNLKLLLCNWKKNKLSAKIRPTGAINILHDFNSFGVVCDRNARIHFHKQNLVD